MATNKIKSLDRLKTMIDKQIQDWLRKIHTETDSDTLPIVLMGVTEETGNCIFRNMSVSAKKMIYDTIREQGKKGVKEPEIQKCLNSIGNLLQGTLKNP